MGVLPIKLMLKLENFIINTSCADLRPPFVYILYGAELRKFMCEMAALGYS